MSGNKGEKKGMEMHFYVGEFADFGIVLEIDNMFQIFHFYQITKAKFAIFKLEFWEICTMLKVLAK